ncbi:MAG: signal peptidase I [Alphaproteobacteria bacterium]|nr:signal peptidase I [Alphaproteobacteria bacterium]
MADPESYNPLDDEPQESWRDVLLAWGPAFLAVIFIRLFIFEPFRIPSGSMVPTLLIGDHVLVTKFSYGIWLPLKSLGVPFTSIGLDDIGLDLDNIELVDLGDPQRGDVIVFHYPMDEDITYIKRVVGLPGDRIRVVDNQIILNGERQERVPLGTFDDVDDQCHVREARRWRETLARGDGTTLDHAILTNIGRPGLLSDRREITVPPDSVFVMGDNRDHSQDSRAWEFVRFDQIKGKAHAIWLSWDGCHGNPGSFRLDRMPKSLYDESDVQGGPAPEAAAAAPSDAE